jgi:hypothetical protein
MPNTNVEDLRDWLDEENPEALLMDGFEDAILGVACQYSRPPLVVYDRERCIEVLVKRDAMTYEEAEEYFSFNCEGAWVGEGTPLILTRFEDQ